MKGHHRALGRRRGYPKFGRWTFDEYSFPSKVFSPQNLPTSKFTAFKIYQSQNSPTSKCTNLKFYSLHNLMPSKFNCLTGLRQISCSVRRSYPGLSISLRNPEESQYERSSSSAGAAPGRSEIRPLDV